MPRYQVTLRQDAWLNHLAIVEAHSADAAVDAARNAWKTGVPSNIKFEEAGFSTSTQSWSIPKTANWSMTPSTMVSFQPPASPSRSYARNSLPTRGEKPSALLLKWARLPPMPPLLPSTPSLPISGRRQLPRIPKSSSSSSPWRRNLEACNPRFRRWHGGNPRPC